MKEELNMKKEKNIPNAPEEVMDQPLELTEEELDQASGAGNPFDDLPRVPTQPIDPEGRDKV